MDSRPQQSFLKSKCVVFTGRLASMSRQEAIRLVVERGGRASPKVSRLTLLVVIGSDGWPLRSTGKLTRNLLRSERLQQRSNSKLRVISEAEFLEQLGSSKEVDIRRRYTLEQLSRMVGVSGLRLRNWIKRSFLRPVSYENGVALFDFAQLSAARSLVSLVSNTPTLKNVAHSLGLLQRWLPTNTQLVEHLLQINNLLVVRDLEGRLVDTNGQYLFGFCDPLAAIEPAFVSAKMRLQKRAEKTPATPSSAAHVRFNRAYQLEQKGHYQDAMRAYQRCLRDGPTDDVYYNLGNTLTRLGQNRRAVSMLRKCIRLNTAHCHGWNNLGLAFARLGLTNKAIHALRRAILLNPEYNDALYNLADILDECGKIRHARLIWLQYLKYSENCRQASYVRERLRDTE